MRLLIMLCFLTLISCNDIEGNIVDVNSIDEKIYVSMSKASLIEKIGTPKDSVLSELFYPGTYYYIYKTNDLSGYNLTIWFNEKDKVSFYRID